MFSVYDPTCNRLRDPQGVREPLTFRWRLGSDRPQARMVARRVYVTSLEDGECRWDSGKVSSDVCEVRYAGDPLAPGETCVWFVTVEDEEGTEYHSVPAARSALALCGPRMMFSTRCSRTRPCDLVLSQTKSCGV